MAAKVSTAGVKDSGMSADSGKGFSATTVSHGWAFPWTKAHRQTSKAARRRRQQLLRFQTERILPEKKIKNGTMAIIQAKKSTEDLKEITHKVYFDVEIDGKLAGESFW
ncbi:uncharacterized protein LOC133793952 [Humulus lupulus]|uniref:uncharacterized protein LOC133793952 n=1 Tax=Humulus lupulus TaxID=3486 RepID=UPI002B41487C|nr:uncharacterized protein LOC133793952 [Humulus lupulus]